VTRARRERVVRLSVLPERSPATWEGGFWRAYSINVGSAPRWSYTFTGCVALAGGGRVHIVPCPFERVRLYLSSDGVLRFGTAPAILHEACDGAAAPGDVRYLDAEPVASRASDAEALAIEFVLAQPHVHAAVILAAGD